MRILIITSKNHIYANLFLKKAFEKDLFKKTNVFILEQDVLIPGKTKLSGFLKYLKISGIYYVFAQISKHYLFILKSFINLTTLKYESIFFPYWKTKKYSGVRKTFNGIKTARAYKLIKTINPDLIVSVFSKEIIPKRIFEIPKLGTINIHPSFLPSYKGISPIFWCMVNNENHTGVTIHYITSQIDAGNIIAKKKIDIGKYNTEHGLYLRLTEEGFRLFVEYFMNVTDKKNKIKSTIQTEEIQSYYSLPTKEAVKKFLGNGYKFFTIKEIMG